MTETTLVVKDIEGDANVVPNDALAKVAQRNLEEVGGFRYTAEERHFAEELQRSLPSGGACDLDSTALIQPLRGPDPNSSAASTGVGDVRGRIIQLGAPQTDKGEHKIFKPRIAKLMPVKQRSPAPG